MALAEGISWLKPALLAICPENNVGRAALALATVGCATVLWKWLTRGKKRVKRLREAIQKRQDERATVEAELKKALGAANAAEIKKRETILNLSFLELKEGLQMEEFTALEALQAFQTAALSANERLNCVTQFITEAEKWAKALDEKYNGTEKPPLFGIPFSVKESIAVAGYDSTRGYAHTIGEAAQRDADCVRLLRQMGAVPFARTNVPQTLLSFGCQNPIYGRTLNPHSTEHTCGGSSGGEAALLAAGGSPFGIGGDVGGSLRIPAHFSGCAAFKPSKARAPQLGSLKSVPGRPMICASMGPMAMDVDALITLMRVFASEAASLMDPRVVPLPFQDGLLNEKRPLTIGYYDYDVYCEAVPACRRAVREAKEILERAGHKLIRWQQPREISALPLLFGAGTVDNGKYITELLDKDIEDPHLKSFTKFLRTPIWMKRLLARFAKDRPAQLLRGNPGTTSEMRLLNERVEKLQALFDRAWRGAELDCLICPAFGTVALPHEAALKCLPAATYTGIFNLLDYPAGVVPVTRVRAEDEALCKDYKVVDDWAKAIKQASSEGTVGLPVGVQCAALPYQEELVLRVLKQIEQGQ